MSEEKRKGKLTPKILVIVLILILMAFFALKGMFWLFDYGHSGIHWSYYCANNMRILGRAMLMYANDNNSQYPTADKWCDLLIEYDTDNKEQLFKCKGAGKGRCHFAINPYCSPNSPNDIVLLFETKGGWNQYGSTELLTLNNHKGKGANVLYNNGRTIFISPREVDHLKWKSDEAQEE